MTTGNTIIIKSFDNVVFVPVECVQAGTDSIPYVYRKDGIKQIIIPGESNEKNMIVEKGLEKGELLYLNNPEKPEKFKVKGSELVPLIRERRRKV
jgi:hypothetical protein